MSFTPPHSEDHHWRAPDQSRLLRHADDETLQTALRGSKKRAVADIFEAELYDSRKVKPGTGKHSLGTIKLRHIKDFRYKTVVYEGREKSDARLYFSDESGNFFPAVIVKDLNVCCYADYLHTYSRWSHEQISQFFFEKFQQADLWLRIGLAREWNGWCFLQITGIYTFPDYLDGDCFNDASRHQTLVSPLLYGYA
jgi:hypothetical protein